MIQQALQPALRRMMIWKCLFVSWALGSALMTGVCRAAVQASDCRPTCGEFSRQSRLSIGGDRPNKQNQTGHDRHLHDVV